jgi:hypothetical protein
MSNQYSGGSFDSDETRRRKSEAAKRDRRTGVAKAEWARIQANIDRIVAEDKRDGSQPGYDVFFYLRKVERGGFLHANRMGRFG